MPTSIKELLDLAKMSNNLNPYYKQGLLKDSITMPKDQFDLKEQKKRIEYNAERNLPNWIDVRTDGKPQVIARPQARCTNPHCFRLGNVYHFVGTHLMVCYHCGHNMLDFNSMVIPKRVGPYGFQYAIPKTYAQAKFMKDHDLHGSFF